LSSAKKGFLLTDALVSVFVVFVLCGLVFSTALEYLTAKETIERAAEEMEEEAAYYFGAASSLCYECRIKEEEEEQDKEEDEEWAEESEDSFSPIP
jgi:hypothetical protein